MTLYHSEKNQNKVFGKGLGGEPFLRKVSPDIKYKLLYEYRGYFGDEFLLQKNRHESKCADLFSLSLSLSESHFLVCYV